MNTSFGNKLKEIREASNMTQTELATLLNVGLRQAQRYEADQIPKADKIKLLSIYFGYDFFELVPQAKLPKNGSKSHNPRDKSGMDYTLNTSTKPGLKITNPTEIAAENARLKAENQKLEDDNKFLKDLLKNLVQKS